MTILFGHQPFMVIGKVADGVMLINVDIGYSMRTESDPNRCRILGPWLVGTGVALHRDTLYRPTEMCKWALGQSIWVLAIENVEQLA